jgi:hypothetical protein
VRTGQPVIRTALHSHSIAARAGCARLIPNFMCYLTKGAGVGTDPCQHASSIVHSMVRSGMCLTDCFAFRFRLTRSNKGELNKRRRQCACVVDRTLKKHGRGYYFRFCRRTRMRSWHCYSAGCAWPGAWPRAREVV